MGELLREETNSRILQIPKMSRRHTAGSVLMPSRRFIAQAVKSDRAFDRRNDKLI